MAEDIVIFLTPDGQKVSNDPRWQNANPDAREKMLAARPNSGTVGVPKEEFEAQHATGARLANLQSGQPGVGENAVPSDPSEYNPTTQKSPAQLAGEAQQRNLPEDLVPQRREVEVEDSNEKVLEARKELEKRREKAAKAEADLGDEGPGDPEQPYSEWSAKQLKAEVLRRNAERGEEDQIDTKGIRKSSELAQKLEEDDQARAEQ